MDDTVISLLVKTDSLLVDTELVNACNSKNAKAVEDLLIKRSAESDSCNFISPGEDYYKVLSFLWNESRKYHDSLMDIIMISLSRIFHNKGIYGSLFTISARKSCGDILKIILCKWREENERELTNWLTSTEEDGNPALHYVVENGQTLDHEFVKTLIMDGDCINVENKDGIRVIDRIPSNIIEDILNECISEPNGSSNDRKNEDYNLEMDFSLFVHKEGLNTQNESDFIRSLHNSKSHKHLLFHPLITTLLHIKWQKNKYIWYVNESFNVLFYFLILLYMFHFRKEQFWFGVDCKETNLLTMRIIITTMGSILILREITQFKLFKLEYLKSFDNYLEVAILGMTMTMLYNDYTPAQQSIAAWLVVFITVEFLLLVEKMHLLRISLYISMFRKVTYNFLKLTSLLIFLVIAFAVSFYLLIELAPNNETKIKLNESNEKKCENQTIIEILGGLNQNKTKKFADSFRYAVLKTVIMSTGEFEYSSLDFQRFPAASLLFTVFIFSIFLVAMNLLNGIAISDIQEIQNHASIYQIKDQVECVINFDNFFPLRMFNKKKWNRGLISHNCFSDKIITSYPNRNFSSASVTCGGHKILYCTNKFLLYINKVINIISFNKCGDVDNFCKECRSIKKENNHQCIYKHNYIILPKFVTCLKKIKEDSEINDEKKRTEKRLLKIENTLILIEKKMNEDSGRNDDMKRTERRMVDIEKSLIEQKKTDNSAKNHHQKLKEIWEQCNKQDITLEEFLSAIENSNIDIASP